MKLTTCPHASFTGRTCVDVKNTVPFHKPTYKSKQIRLSKIKCSKTSVLITKCYSNFISYCHLTNPVFLNKSRYIQKRTRKSTVYLHRAIHNMHSLKPLKYCISVCFSLIRLSLFSLCVRMCLCVCVNDYYINTCY